MRLIGGRRYNQATVTLERSMKTPSVPGLECGLTVLELLAHSRTGLTLPEIARNLELPKSSAHSLLITLERLGYLHRNERTSRSVCGTKLLSLGNLSLSGLPVRSAAAPYMLALTERTGLTTHLAVLERNEAVLVEKWNPAAFSSWWRGWGSAWICIAPAWARHCSRKCAKTS